MTSDHLLPLEVSADSLALGQVASLFSRAQVPLEIMEALGAGRMTALKKPDGGVRGIVVGEIFRRVTARTIAQQYSKKVEVATALHQYALVTKSGCETVAHMVASPNRVGPSFNCGLCGRHRCLRPHLKERHDERVAPRGGGRSHFAIRASILRQTVNIHLGGRRW